MKFCTSCGHKVNSSDHFCRNCGTELSHVTGNDNEIKSDINVENMISDTKKSRKKNKRIVKKLLLPIVSVLIVGSGALVAYNIIQDNKLEKQAMFDQAVQDQNEKQRLKKLEKCVVENFANAHGNSDKVWGYLKVMCSLRNAEVEKYQIEWGKNLELLKEKNASNTLAFH